MNRIVKTHKPPMRNFRRDEEAVRELSPEQFRVTQRGSTECPGTGEYLHNEEPGIYVDVVSGEPLFASSDRLRAPRHRDQSFHRIVITCSTAS